MNVLVLGSGGREHALGLKITESPSAKLVFAMPGNVGMKLSGQIEVLDGDISDHESVLNKVKENNIDLVIVGPEGPLASGISDFLNDFEVSVFGPGQAAAMLESSKIFSKKFMREHSIPTADFRFYENYDEAIRGIDSWDFSEGIVIKADSLAAGKGVVLTNDPSEAKRVVYDFMENPNCSVKTDSILFEKTLKGKEVSAFAICDGKTFIELGHVCDYKRARYGDQGPNTGGMGCYTPNNWPSGFLKEKIKKDVFQKVIDGMNKDGNPFVGILFAGLMVDGDDFNVIEFNVRLGDPETQTLMPLLDGDLLKAFKLAADGQLASLGPEDLKLYDKKSVHVVLASGGYPSIDKTPMSLGNVIDFDLTQFNEKKKLYFSGVKQSESGALINSGGRVLGVTAVADNIEDARIEAYKLIKNITLKKSHFRSDIAKLS